MREGAELVDQLGTFAFLGERLIFVPVGGRRRLIGLENLNLERVGRAMMENPEATSWTVAGTVSEYRGANYLLIRRAVQKYRDKSGSSPPTRVEGKKP